MPMLAAYRNLFCFFLDFVVCRFCTSKQCFGYFCLGSAMRVLVEVLVCDSEKTSFCQQVLGGPRSANTKHVLVNLKAFTKTCFLTAFLQCRWGCLYSKTLFKSI
jgi:hypothetical protein